MSTLEQIEKVGQEMAAYLIVNFDVEDSELYAEYASEASQAMGIGEDGQILVADSESERLEGESAGHRTIVVRFESKQRARALYESGEYQALLPKRLAATSSHFAILVEGIPG